PYEPISSDTLADQIGIVRDFFRARLRANREEPLVEDEDLPQKQRFPKPRLPANGKISSPRKRPIREQQQAAKKKRKMEEGGVGGGGGDEMGGGGSNMKLGKPVGALKFRLPERSGENGGGDPEKEGETYAEGGYREGVVCRRRAQGWSNAGMSHHEVASREPGAAYGAYEVWPNDERAPAKARESGTPSRLRRLLTANDEEEEEERRVEQSKEGDQ
ncbi:hypothetical protein B0A55_13002, partial [Friedmanniomyces simplex]